MILSEKGAMNRYSDLTVHSTYVARNRATLTAMVLWMRRGHRMRFRNPWGIDGLKLVRIPWADINAYSGLGTQHCTTIFHETIGD